MRVTSDLGRLPVRRVRIVEILEEGDDEILDLALEHTGETRGRLFGWSVTRGEDDPTTALVLLHTD